MTLHAWVLIVQLVMAHAYEANCLCSILSIGTADIFCLKSYFYGYPISLSLILQAKQAPIPNMRCTTIRRAYVL